MATYKQKLVASKIVENRGNISKSMLEAGYSPNTARNPKNLTNSCGWKELVNDKLSGETLVNAHRQLMKSSKLKDMSFPASLTDAEITGLLEPIGYKVQMINRLRTRAQVWLWEVDMQARAKALDMAYRLKSLYPERKTRNSHSSSSETLRIEIQDYASRPINNTQNIFHS
ncbi:MAG TPA: hypothetical protein VMQ44_02360 [Candidatus Saccharimonadales bacterium]|nr:hypothetical protein [Candidatus Saccharimonadales bacterium]